MTRDVTLAAAQFACVLGHPVPTSPPLSGSSATPPGRGADRPDPELFEGPYFCKDQTPRAPRSGAPLDGHPRSSRFGRRRRTRGRVAAQHLRACRPGVVQHGGVVDADGAVLGNYRKSHIPDGPGYTEKYYFSPGDTGFRVWDTRRPIGVGICWDQWFPESARSMALLGAEVLLYPTAIGSEPPDPRGLERALAARDAGTRRRQPHAARRRQSIGREVGGRARSRSTGRRSSPTTPARRSPRRPRWRGGARGIFRPRCVARHYAAGGCSTTGVPTCTARCSRSTARRRRQVDAPQDVPLAGRGARDEQDVRRPRRR